MAGFRLFDLNEAQSEAVTHIEGPLLILAGAGTGKTRVITARIAYLMANGTAPANIVAVTFTNKAAKEMRERLANLVEPAAAKKVTVSTFHALCVRILRSGIDRLGYKNNFAIYDESDQLGLLKKIITRTAAKDEKLEPNLAKNLISKAKNNGWGAPQDEQSLIGAVFARYQEGLKALNAVDFDDLLLLTVKLLNEHADVREKWQEKFHQIMVDEFQDTNRLQLELVSLLAPKNGRPNVCVVGDDDQSIYGWRGAEVSNILEFERHFPGPRVVKLEQNYRSTNAILNSANSIIKNNPRRRPKQLWSGNGDGEKVRIIEMPDDRQEAQFVVDEIQRAQTETGAPFEAFAVLFRMNAQARVFEEALRRAKIPYRIIGSRSFFDKREVRDVLAYLACIENANDDISLLRIINTPARGISPATTERALEFSIAHKSSLHKALQTPAFLDTLTKRTTGAIGDFLSLLDEFDTRMHTPLTSYADVFDELLKETGYIDDMKRSCKTAEEADGREQSVQEIIGLLRSYQGRSSDGLRGFLDEMALDKDRDDDKEEKEAPGVTLITLHAAKGLEFPHVHLVGIEEGVLPHDRSKLEGTIDEERRLLYVGVTRAMRTLCITYCRGRMKYGSSMPCTASSFLKELDPAHIERTTFQELMGRTVAPEAASGRFAQLKATIGKL